MEFPVNGNGDALLNHVPIKKLQSSTTFRNFRRGGISGQPMKPD